MKRIVLGISLLFFTVLLATACGQNNAATAVNYIEALNDQNIELATEMTCPEVSDVLVDSLMTVEEDDWETIEFQRVTCSQLSANEADCRFTIRQEDTDINNETVFMQDRNVVFNFEDGLICGFEEQVAN